jgi:hypothetical protein
MPDSFEDRACVMDIALKKLNMVVVAAKAHFLERLDGK